MIRRVLAIAATTAALVSLSAAAAAARPAPNAVWLSAGSTKQTVNQTRAVFLKNKVYMPGGWLNDFSTMYDGMQIYAATSGTWSVDKEPIPSGALAQMAVCTDGSKVYLVGGINSSGVQLSTMQIYDPSEPKGSRWSTGPNVHTTADGDLYDRAGGCAWIGGKLYYFGGQAYSDTGTVSGTTGLTWVYKPSTGLWSDTGFSMNAPTSFFAYASNAQNAFAAGGENDTDNTLRDAEMFTPSSGWSAMTKLPVPKGAPSGTGLEGSGLGFLGSSLAVFGGNASNSVQSRTLVCALPCGSGDKWTNAKKNLATPRGDFAWAYGGSTPTLYAIDGQGADPGFISTAEKTT